jgi:hypothetical protein
MNTAAVRTPAGFRQHVEAVPHATESRAFRHSCRIQNIAHALVQFTVEVLRSSLRCHVERLPVEDNEPASNDVLTGKSGTQISQCPNSTATLRQLTTNDSNPPRQWLT